MDNDRGSTEDAVAEHLSESADAQRLEGSPEDWVQELRAAGWTNKGMSVWITPGGIMFRGPALALKKKRAHPELAYLTMKDLHDTRFVR